MRTIRVALLLVTVATVTSARTPAAAGEPSADERLLSAARETARWVARQARPADGDGPATFPEYAEAPDEIATSPLYAGSAGVLVFLENAGHVLDDPALRALADRTAAGLLTAPRAPRDRPGSAGLYTGDAGVAAALLVRWTLRRDREALDGARRLGDDVVARLPRGDEDGLWDDGYDVIAGAAGTVLALLALDDADEPVAAMRRFADAAVRAGRALARRGVPDASDASATELRLWWPSARTSARHYPGFSHGTAGVVYALARVAIATRDATCRDAALAGGRWLLAHARRTETTLAWSHYLPGHEEVFLEGWCHGPAGTGRALLALHALTGDATWLDAARRAAAWAMAERPAVAGTAFYSPSLCCGIAGLLDFFVDLARRTDDPTHRAYALGLADRLLALSKSDAVGRRWTNYDHPDEKGVVYHGVSLMLGASGEGLALLRAATLARAEDPVASLPDRVVPGPTADASRTAPADAPPATPTPAAPPAASPPAPAPRAPEAPTSAVRSLEAHAVVPPTGHDGTAYVVLTSGSAPDDPFVVAGRRLAAWRKGTLVTGFDPTAPERIVPRLRELGARRVALVLPADEIDVNAQRRFLRIAARLDDDPFVDLSFGFLTATAATTPTAMVERAQALEAAGVARRWTSVSVASASPGFVVEAAGDPTARRAGWTGRTVYWPCRETDGDALAFARRTAAQLEGGGVVTFAGCGDPEGTWLFSDRRNADRSKHWPFDPARVGEDPRGEMPRATADLFRRMHLRGTVVWDGVCHSGSIHRVFVEGDIVSTFGTVDRATAYVVPPGRSVGAAILDAGAVALVAPLGPNHGYATLVEAEAAFERRLDLGDVVRSTWDEVAIATGRAPSPDLYEPGGGPVDVGEAMTGGAMNRALYGDPALSPFAREHVDPAVVVDRTPPATGATGFVVAARVRAKTWAQWDLYGVGGGHERIRATVDVSDVAATAFDVRARAAGADGTPIEADRLVALVERIDGKRWLHVQVAAPRGRGLGEVGSSAVFEVTPAAR